MRVALCHHYDVIRSHDHSTQHRRFPIRPKKKSRRDNAWVNHPRGPIYVIGSRDVIGSMTIRLHIVLVTNFCVYMYVIYLFIIIFNIIIIIIIIKPIRRSLGCFKN